jgi:A/G-specific adenine glycosylase
MNIKEIIVLKNWFLSNSRDLPWRINSDPYAIWISEVMLQQTQVSVVISYFERWMHRFPTIRSLAAASIDDVLKQWEGLGYYSRARYLHEGAKYVVEHFNGQLPSSPTELKKIKGLGSYTVGAIMNFAFHQRMAAVDGNVLRVLARYYGLQDDISKVQTVKKISQMVESLLPEEEPWVISEALIEIGATVCMKKPKCEECPIIKGCKAFEKGLVSQLPVKSSKVVTTPLYRTVAVILSGNKILIGRGAKGKVMADLYEFPYFELDSLLCDPQILVQKIHSQFKFETTWVRSLSRVTHSFTRYRAHLIPHLLTIKESGKVEGFEWLSLDCLKKQPFSSGHRRIFMEIETHLETQLSDIVT